MFDCPVGNLAAISPLKDAEYQFSSISHWEPCRFPARLASKYQSIQLLV